MLVQGKLMTLQVDWARFGFRRVTVPSLMSNAVFFQALRRSD